MSNVVHGRFRSGIKCGLFAALILALVVLIAGMGFSARQEMLDHELLDAATHGDVKKLQADLAKGANINARNRAGWTSILIASDMMRHDLVLVLIHDRANVNITDSRKVTALMHWSRHGDLDVVSALLNARANINASDVNGNTALMSGVVSGNIQVVKLLLEKGADRKPRNNKGHTASDIALKNDFMPIYKLLGK